MVTNCTFCADQFEYEPFIVNGSERFKPTACATCIATEDEKARSEESERKARARSSAWDDVCPPLFKDSDISRIPGRFQAIIHNWRFGSRGVGFIGRAGLCKTRSAFLLLRAQHFAGRKCAAVTAMEIGRLATAQFSNDNDSRAYALKDLAEMRYSQVLLIDDLGKGKMSDRAELELFDTLNHRTSNLLPTIWTANASGDDFLAMMSKDRGEPILRRLAEFSEIVTA